MLISEEALAATSELWLARLLRLPFVGLGLELSSLNFFVTGTWLTSLPRFGDKDPLGVGMATQLAK